MTILVMIVFAPRTELCFFLQFSGICAFWDVLIFLRAWETKQEISLGPEIVNMLWNFKLRAYIPWSFALQASAVTFFAFFLFFSVFSFSKVFPNPWSSIAVGGFPHPRKSQERRPSQAGALPQHHELPPAIAADGVPLRPGQCLGHRPFGAAGADSVGGSGPPPQWQQTPRFVETGLDWGIEV